MKTFIILIILCSINKMSKSQTTYDTCHHLNDYAGEWRYTNGQDTIRLYLKAYRTSSSNFTSDRLWGWVEYKHGTQLIMSDYSRRNMTLTSNFNTMSDSTSFRMSLNACSTTPTKMIGFHRDFLQGNERKRITGNFHTNRTQLTIKLHHSQGYGVFSGYQGMTLPSEFTLIKQ